MGDSNYNLKGLKLVFIGLIVQLASSASSGATIGDHVNNITTTSGLDSGVDVFSVIMGITSLVGLILVIVGLSKVKMYSINFLKARNYYIVNILLGVAVVILAVIMAGLAVSSISTYNLSGSTSTGSGTIIALVVIVFVLAVVMAVIGLLAIRGMMLGCADVAAANGDEFLAVRCRRAWKLFLAAALITIAASVALLIAIIVAAVSTIGSSSFGSDYHLGMAGGLIAAIIFIVAAVIFSIVAQILIIVRVWNTYSRFNGKAMPGTAETISIPGFAQGEWIHVNDSVEPQDVNVGPDIGKGPDEDR